MKKEYQKPALHRVSLKVGETVLVVCKNENAGTPNLSGTDCISGTNPCRDSLGTT
jgi:hypothetical protein